MNNHDKQQSSDKQLADRLTGLFVADGDNDDDAYDDLLMIQRNDRLTVMQWLQALDVHVIGACRSDERLKPLLKVNVSSGVAEDRLLSNLSQHFEPSEVGLLARCLCVPLVSVRVGKIDKRGSLLVPNSARGNLTLSLSPTSDLRISFLGDDGRVERLSTLRNISDCSSVVIEGISADNSGRSFMIKVPTTAKCFYFWCSEKSRLLGNELLDKMKNLLKTKPSLADLSGISDSRLECFVTHLRTYHVGSNTQVNNTALVSLTGSPSTTSIDLGETGKSSQAASLASKSSRGRILSPRSSSFKEGPPRNLVSLKNVAREKFRRKGEAGTFSSVDTLSVSSPSCTNTTTLNQSFNAKIPESAIDTQMFPLVNGLEVDLAEKTFDTPALSSTPPISPYYCWCSPVASTLQYTVAPLQMMSMSVAESFTLPPLASLLSGSNPRSSSSSLLTPEPSLNLDEIPPFLPEPMVRLPISIPSSQQIPVFTPLMTDSIVHIPVIDICSSGQAYLVSAGPAMNVNIPTLHQAFMSPLIQETDSMAEKSARDTLQMLISGSSQLPSVLANVDGNQNVLASGSRGLYEDVNDAIANSIAAMGLVSLTDKSSGVMRRCLDQGDLGVYYYFYQIFRSKAEAAALRRKKEGSGDGSVGMLSSLMVAAMSGCVNVLLTNPIWVVVTRMQTHTKKSPSEEVPSIVSEQAIVGGIEPPPYATSNTVQEVFDEAGIWGFWKGVFPTLIMVSNPSIQFMLYETLLKKLKQRRASRNSNKGVTALEVFLLGALAKLGATVVTYPLLVVKSRLQAKQAIGVDKKHHYKGTLDAILKMIHYEGLHVFYKGMSTKIVQSVLAAAVLFMVKEELVNGARWLLLKDAANVVKSKAT